MHSPDDKTHVSNFPASVKPYLVSKVLAQVGSLLGQWFVHVSLSYSLHFSTFFLHSALVLLVSTHAGFVLPTVHIVQLGCALQYASLEESDAHVAQSLKLAFVI
jgi:hypothetical protein